MTFKKKVVSLVGLILLVAASWMIFHTNVWDKNAELLKNEILRMDTTVESVSLLTLTPFEWDKMYSFTPYTSRESIYETVGYKWDSISETVSEGMNQLVFMKNEKVVCYVYGHPHSNGYYMTFNTLKDDYTVTTLYAKDNVQFSVSKGDGFIYLKQSPE